jgi:hypothetical protein
VSEENTNHKLEIPDVRNVQPERSHQTQREVIVQVVHQILFHFLLVIVDQTALANQDSQVLVPKIAHHAPRGYTRT